MPRTGGAEDNPSGRTTTGRKLGITVDFLDLDWFPDIAQQGNAPGRTDRHDVRHL